MIILKDINYRKPAGGNLSTSYMEVYPTMSTIRKYKTI